MVPAPLTIVAGGASAVTLGDEILLALPWLIRRTSTKITNAPPASTDQKTVG